MSAWEEYKKNLGDARPWQMLNKSNFTSLEISDNRLSICKECPELIKFTTQCKKCGCFMAAKTKLENATCPLGKW